MTLLLAVIAIATATVPITSPLASAHSTTTTVVNTVDGAPKIGLIGDSTLAG
jgi:hypothetical protein